MVSQKLKNNNVFTIAKRNVEGQDMLYQSLKLTNGIWVLAELKIQPNNPSFMVCIANMIMYGEAFHSYTHSAVHHVHVPLTSCILSLHLLTYSSCNVNCLLFTSIYGLIAKQFRLGMAMDVDIFVTFHVCSKVLERGRELGVLKLVCFYLFGVCHSR